MARLQAVLMGAAVIITAALMTCRSAPPDGVAQDTSYRMRPGYVIDSVRPIDVELARFRQGIGADPGALAGGAGSFDALIIGFERAVQANDTAALLRMQVTAEEFAYLIYPSSPYTKPPYLQAPQFVWRQLRTGDVGLTRLLKRRGGSRLAIVSHQCDAAPEIEGDNKLWRRCSVTTVSGSDTLNERLFGVVIERHGRFKFASYQNQY